MNAMSYARTAKANRYLDDSLETSSPAALLVMLYDRLVLDLKRAEEAQRAGDRETAHTNLLHAQDIVRELLASLKTDDWEGGPGLSSLYTWLLQELVAANLSCDADRTATCRTATVEPLADAWRQAALEVMGAASPAGSAS